MSKDGPEDHFTTHHYAAEDARGPLPFLNSTRRRIPLSTTDARSVPTADARAPPDDASLGKTTTRSVYHIWRARDNRKGRHAIAVTEEYAGKSALRPTNSLVEILKGVGKMFVRFPVWDVSYDVAMIYTIGLLPFTYSLHIGLPYIHHTPHPIPYASYPCHAPIRTTTPFPTPTPLNLSFTYIGMNHTDRCSQAR